jgi:two-component system response regulator VicR
MHAPEPYRVAFVEGSTTHAYLLQLLAFEGIVVSAHTQDDLRRIRALGVDLVILNHTRLRSSTAAVAEALCAGRGGSPLSLALVACGNGADGVELVERGVDAYVELSCGPREFVARVRALLRRARPAEPIAGHRERATDDPVRVADIQVDPQRRRARVHGRDVRLTEHEFQLLYVLAAHSGRVFDRQALLDAVWGRDTFVTVRSVDALVKRLRQQLRGAGPAAAAVETVRGVGYRLAENAKAACR